MTSANSNHPHFTRWTVLFTVGAGITLVLILGWLVPIESGHHKEMCKINGCSYIYVQISGIIYERTCFGYCFDNKCNSECQLNSTIICGESSATECFFDEPNSLNLTEDNYKNRELTAIGFISVIAILTFIILPMCVCISIRSSAKDDLSRYYTNDYRIDVDGSIIIPSPNDYD
jgi:hypothetical protein